ncbi:MAG: hypothetical protein JJT77_13060 [Crocinitomicaceae bacterium]|nr:hypothetical protein [Crocinitomicaceae bacterium]
MKVILRKFIFVFLCSSLLLACDRENEKWAYYNETQCADPWEAATSDNELLSALSGFFSEINVQTSSIVFTEDNSLYTCNACGCYTGRVIEVRATASNVNKLVAHGFIPFTKEE